LWDNGNNPADELNRVMEVRSIALKNFGERNIRSGTPYALLEEALVPMYFFHRYQAEATVKMIGGLNYRYALRGDGQPITQSIPAAQQMKALDALLNTVTPQSLMLPTDLIKIIPPHPIGYDRSREVIKTRTDLIFDPVAAAESASDMVFGLLFHPARATRLVQQHALSNDQPSFESVIDKTIQATFKSANKQGYEAQLQMTANHALLMNVMRLALNANASVQARAVAQLKIEQLKIWLTEKLKTQLTENWKAHYAYELEQINSFKDDPKTFEADKLLVPPPGQPIGQEDAFCSHE
jgi:hypothetical protein